jgi:hypothetical protein
MGNKVKGFIDPFWLKIIGAVLLVIALLSAVGAYNHHQREIGRDEIRAEWTLATKAQQDAFDAERKRLQDARFKISEQYNASESARRIMERESGREREEAIAASDVADNACFDERMRDNWNRDSGRTGGSGTGPRVDGALPKPAK